MQHLHQYGNLLGAFLSIYNNRVLILAWEWSLNFKDETAALYAVCSLGYFPFSKVNILEIKAMLAVRLIGMVFSAFQGSSLSLS